jgi:hypothetical protein
MKMITLLLVLGLATSWIPQGDRPNLSEEEIQEEEEGEELAA